MRASRQVVAALVGIAVLTGLGLATTSGLARAAANTIVINEVESDGDPAGDWVELTNKGTSPVDISGLVIRDDKDTSAVTVPNGVTLAPGGYYVVHTGEVGLGKADMARLFAADGTTQLDSYSWTSHASTTYGRCPDANGPFSTTARPTPGAANACRIPTGVIVINEIESQAGSPDDWVELKNIGDAPIDISGYVLSDNSDDHRYTIPAGTNVAPGAYLTIDIATVEGGFGLGGADAVRLFNGLTLVDSRSWEQHSPTSLGRCPDGLGTLVDTTAPTKNAPNSCPLPQVRINEIKSTGEGPDAIELYNLGSTDVDLTGFVLKDDNDNRNLPLPPGSVITAGGYLVFTEGKEFTFGLGNGDAARLFTPGGTVVDEHTYPSHGVPSWGRCPNGTGEFVQTTTLSLGAPNPCGDTPPSSSAPSPSGPEAKPWPGSQDPTPVDVITLKDSSGLDYESTGPGAGVLWGVDNGTGTLWKWDVDARGATTVAPGWEQGKRVRFIRDAARPTAPGPDAEGVTVGPDGMLYVASERDNSDKGVNQNTVMKVDPNAPGPDLVAAQEWDLTALLPQVSANTGIEAVEFIGDEALAGKLWDAGRAKAYDPADHPGHGSGLFFVALEDNGHVYGFALNEDGTATLVAEIASGLGGVMALDYDSELGVLWAMCDDGCRNSGVQISFTTSAHGTRAAAVRGQAISGGAQVTLIAGPSRLPVANLEGFAVATNLCVAAQRPVWWFQDGITEGALRQGWLPCVAPAGTDPSPAPRPTQTPTGAPGGGSATPSSPPSSTGRAGTTPRPLPNTGA